MTPKTEQDKAKSTAPDAPSEATQAVSELSKATEPVTCDVCGLRITGEQCGFCGFTPQPEGES